MIRRIAWAAALLGATLLSWFVADTVPSEDGGLVPAGLLLLTLGGILLRRQTLPRSDRAALDRTV